MAGGDLSTAASPRAPNPVAAEVQCGVSNGSWKSARRRMALFLKNGTGGGIHSHFLWLQTQLHFISKEMNIPPRLAPSAMKSCYLSPLCPCLAIRERMPRSEMNSLAACRGTEREEKRLCPPEQGGLGQARGKSSAQRQGLHSSPGSRRSRDNFPGTRRPVPPTWAANTLSPTAASPQSTNPNQYFPSPHLLLTPLWGNTCPGPGSNYPKFKNK